MPRSNAERAAQAPSAPPVADRFRRWSVVAVGVALGGLPPVATAVGVFDLSPTQALPPIAAAAAVAAMGVWLQGSDLAPGDVATVAAWVAASAVAFAAVIGVAAVALSSDPVPVWAYVTAFVAPIGAGFGGVAGYTDARRRRQYRRTRRTERALETATDGIAILDEDGEFATVNRAHAAIYGYDDPEELVGERWTVCYDAPERERLATTVLPGVRAGDSWRGRTIGRRADGTTFPQELTLSPMDDGGVVSVVRDVTERRERERQLREQKRRLATIVENAPIVLFAMDETGEFLLSEGRGLSSLGLEPGEIVGTSVFEQYAAAPAVLAACRRALDGEQVHDTFQLGGQVMEAWYTPVTDDEGTVERVIGTAMDVTDRHERQRQLAALHEASRQLNYATTPAAVAQTTVDIAQAALEMPLSTVWRHDADDERLRLVAMTDSSASLLGVDRVAEHPPIAGDELGMEVLRGGDVRVVEDYRTVDNRALDVPLGTVILVPLGEQGLLAVGRRNVEAVTEDLRRRAGILGANAQAALDRADHEAQLRRRTEELEVRTDQLDFINSIIRHDVLNGMTVIRSRAAFLEADLEGRNREFADTIVRWCDNLTAFVERVQTVLDTLAGDDVELEAVDAAALVRGELERLRRTYPAVTFEADLEGPAYVRADELLADVVGNVLTNALEHNDHTGLVVSVTADADDERTTLRMADNGTGIPPDQREVVFRRGESHAKSTGSGFGLFFVDAMVTAYGGEVWVEDDDGAVFVLELPTAQPPKRDVA